MVINTATSDIHCRREVEAKRRVYRVRRIVLLRSRTACSLATQWLSEKQSNQQQPSDKHAY